MDERKNIGISEPEELFHLKIMNERLGMADEEDMVEMKIKGTLRRVLQEVINIWKGKVNRGPSREDGDYFFVYLCLPSGEIPISDGEVWELIGKILSERPQ